MRALAGILLSSFLLAGTTDDTFKLELLPKAEKGREEKIEFEAKHVVPVGQDTQTKSITGVMKRKVKTLDEDGLPEKEQLTLESAKFEDGTTGPNGGSSMQWDLSQTWTESVKRSGKARRAKLASRPDEFYAELDSVLTDDPDALVRAVLPEGPVAKSEEWEVDPAKLLRLFVSAKAKPAEKAKVTATLDSVKKGEALVTIKGTLRYTTPDDEDERISIEAEVRGPIDGSAPPRKTKVVLTRKQKDSATKKEVKATLTVVLKRSWSDAEDEEGEDEKKDDEKKDAKKKGK